MGSTLPADPDAACTAAVIVAETERDFVSQLAKVRASSAFHLD